MERLDLSLGMVLAVRKNYVTFKVFKQPQKQKKKRMGREGKTSFFRKSFSEELRHMDVF